MIFECVGVPNVIDQIMAGAPQAARIIVVEGTLYPLLNRLQKVGLLAYTWKESPSGPPRKYYRLTDEGSAFLQSLHATWQELTGSINSILNKTNQTNSHE